MTGEQDSTRTSRFGVSISLTRYENPEFTLMGLALSAVSAFVAALMAAQITNSNVSIGLAALYFVVMYSLLVLEVKRD